MPVKLGVLLYLATVAVSSIAFSVAGFPAAVVVATVMAGVSAWLVDRRTKPYWRVDSGGS